MKIFVCSEWGWSRVEKESWEALHESPSMGLEADRRLLLRPGSLPTPIPGW